MLIIPLCTAAKRQPGFPDDSTQRESPFTMLLIAFWFWFFHDYGVLDRGPRKSSALGYACHLEDLLGHARRPLPRYNSLQRLAATSVS